MEEQIDDTIYAFYYLRMVPFLATLLKHTL